MHKYFSDWYREVNLTVSDDVVKKRTKGIEKIAKSTKIDSITQLICLAFRLHTSDERFIETFSKPFVEVDQSFPMKNNENELSILACAVIAEILTSEDKRADITALASACSFFLLPEQTLPPTQDILDEANNYLVQRSTNLRSNLQMSLENSNIDQAMQKLEVLKKKPDGELTVPLLKSSVQEVVLEILNILNQVTTNISQLNKKYETILEESNMFWWTFSGSISDVSESLTDLSLPEACIIAGRSLGRLVCIAPGPLSAKAVLNKSLSHKKPGEETKVQLVEAVNQIPLEWRKKIVNNSVDSLPLFCPVHLAVKTSLSIDGENWWPQYEKLTGMMISKKTAPLDLAYQVYLESVLLSLL